VKMWHEDVSAGLLYGETPANLVQKPTIVCPGGDMRLSMIKFLNVILLYLVDWVWRRRAPGAEYDP